MMVLVLAQVVAGPVLPVPRAPTSPTQGTCPLAAEADEVVVCGRPDQEAFRLRPLPPRYTDPTLPKAETELFGGAAKAAVEAENAGIGGVPSNRLMFRLKTPF